MNHSASPAPSVESAYPSPLSSLIVRLFICIAIFTAFLPSLANAAPDLTPLRSLPTLDAGRIKPIDTAARETIRLLAGKETFKDKQGARWDPLALCLAIEREPLAWETTPLVHVPYLELRSALGLTGEDQHATPQSIRSNEKFRELVSQAAAKRQSASATGELPNLSRLEEKAAELSERLHIFDELASHQRFSLYPNPADPEHWSTSAQKTNEPTWTNLLSASGGGDVNFASAVTALRSAQQYASLKPDPENPTFKLPSPNTLEREVAYHQLHPFRWAWIIYLLSLLSLCTSLVARGRTLYIIGIALFTLGILWSTLSFAWRCSITGWAPVTNIYETVIWVALVGSIVALALEYAANRANRKPPVIPAISGAIAATLSGVVADTMPPEYGGAIRTLVPVLQSNYWLTIHVLTIVSSYAGFLIALVLGNIVLAQFAWAPQKKDTIALNLKHLYRAIQVGVLLVAAGTILGGVWAQDSWGRFWGWDPKEVWALIILLVYLALLHGRYAGWIGTWGLAAGAVICFLAVLMSWYGVNFILGAGLHSYGFNTGGQLYVTTFTALQLAYLAIAYAAHRKHQVVVREPTPAVEEPALS